MNKLTDDEKKIIREHLTDGLPSLSLKMEKLSRNISSDKLFIINQIAGRQKVRDKIPSWYHNEDLIYPPKLSLEQASSELTAQYKTKLLKGNTLVDLTGGIGVDTAFLSSCFSSVVYIERQKELVDIARHNFKILGLSHVETFNAEAEQFLETMSPVDCLFIDPARRSITGRKLVSISDCEPNIILLQDTMLSKSKHILIKLSPMLDIKQALALLNKVAEVHVVSIDNECKELLFLLSNEALSEPEITCVNLNRDGEQVERFYYSEEKDCISTYANTVKQYLYEPNVSILKAGYYKGIALKYKLEKLHRDSHLYTSDNLVADFPGRIFQVTSDFPKERANIATRNYPLSADELRKKLKLKDGGEIFLFGTTLVNGKKTIISTERVNSSSLKR
ncbi:class I SAM-dependent methyltransferase [Bacteroidales bacterium OttesenSCG-928-M11]|nr:class I SAM-dependent methyltransferase [Bacteroidales bacterium OttesenSCG-928-M11]